VAEPHLPFRFCSFDCNATWISIARLDLMPTKAARAKLNALRHRFISKIRLASRYAARILTPPYSITSSASNCIALGTARLSALAVLRLITNSNSAAPAGRPASPPSRSAPCKCRFGERTSSNSTQIQPGFHSVSARGSQRCHRAFDHGPFDSSHSFSGGCLRTLPCSFQDRDGHD
jgi:hypothetical protein